MQHVDQGLEPVDRGLHAWPRAGRSHQAEGRELPFPRRGESRLAIEVGNTVGMEHEALGERRPAVDVQPDQRLEPAYGETRAGAERAEGRAEEAGEPQYPAAG